MGKPSRAKGVAGEKESADLFRAADWDVVQLQNNVLDAGDYIAALPDLDVHPDHEPEPLVRLLVDSKRRERLHLTAASKQVEAVARGGQVPAVVYRANRQPWRISLRLDDFLRIVAR